MHGLARAPGILALTRALDLVDARLLRRPTADSKALAPLVDAAFSEATRFEDIVRGGELIIEDLELVLAEAHQSCTRLVDEVPPLAEVARDLYESLARACAAHPVAVAAGALSVESARDGWSYAELLAAAEPVAAHHGAGLRTVIALALGTFPAPWGPSEHSALEAGRHGYAYSALEILEQALELLEIGPDDVFYDLGAGLGLPCLVAALFGARRAVGVETEASYVERAREQAARLGLGDRVSFVHDDATTCDLARATKLYLFNPFPPPVHARVVERLRALAADHAIRIACWHAKLPDDFPLLERRGALDVYAGPRVEAR